MEGTVTTTLVIHPEDRSTRFLELTYRGLDATVIARTPSEQEMVRLIERHDRIMMMGHGSSMGLFGRGGGRAHVIDSRVAGALAEHDDSLFIWCYASAFLRRHQLSGFSTGMFISEPDEAWLLRVAATDTEIEESNYLFANVVGRFAGQPLPILAAAVKHEYGRLAAINPVAKYNYSKMVCAFEGARGWTVSPLQPSPTGRSAPDFTSESEPVLPPWTTGNTLRPW